MIFPKRWLDDDDADDAARAVLREGRDMDPPAGAQSAVLLAIMGQIGAAGAGGVGAAGAAKAAGTGAAGTGAAGAGTVGAASGGMLKAILIGAFSGLITVTGYSVIESSLAPPARAPSAVDPPSAPDKAPSDNRAAPAPAPTEAATASPSAAASPVPARDTPAPSVSASSTATGSGDPSSSAPVPESSAGVAAPLPGSKEERESRLREENAMMTQARAALRGGDTAGAMSLLEQVRQKFPDGVLGQEREALAIEALAKSGARAAASARAAAFIQAHPSSPHAAKLQVYVQP